MYLSGAILRGALLLPVQALATFLNRMLHAHSLHCQRAHSQQAIHRAYVCVCALSARSMLSTDGRACMSVKHTHTHTHTNPYAPNCPFTRACSGMQATIHTHTHTLTGTHNCTAPKKAQEPRTTCTRRARTLALSFEILLL